MGKKRKGPSKTLPLPQRMQIQRAVELKATTADTTEKCIALYYRAGGIALNRAFGFGEQRIKKFQSALEQVMAEVKGEKFGADFEYAFETLDQAYHQIVKKEGADK